MKKMRKIFVLIMVLILIGGLCGCNVGMGFGNFEYKKVHIDTHHHSGCFAIEKWYDNETGIEVKTKELGSLFLSEGTYFLVGKDCPFCDNK